ncbi:MAG TPA: hypothetical protein VFO18_07145 [Methylomirabilota bacterium]|nr:hypothetical protein [Methylomirabilota bacterium]
MRQGRRLVRVFLLLVAVWALGCSGGSKPARQELDLNIRAGALPADKQLIRAGQGDDIVLRWSADEPITIHLHGYDIEKDLKPGAVTTMWFVARATGRFPITRHAHGEETPLAYLEVIPR